MRITAPGSGLLVCLALVVGACVQEAPPPQQPQPAWQPAPPPAAARCADGPPMCSQDRRLIIQCQRGAWITVRTCLGPQGCGMSQGALMCDTSVANPGDPCGPDGSSGCTPDGRASTVCRGGRAAIASTCRGSKGCSVTSGVACDHSVAAPGDPCDEQNGIACSTDRKTMLRCAGPVFVVAEACRNACLSAGGRVLCQ
ncbi:MAG: hypothetical protein KC657_28190 [Myxococcales bacterium]|nr:hypothetical protein [Myxococcales bacterium]